MTCLFLGGREGFKDCKTLTINDLQDVGRMVEWPCNELAKQQQKSQWSATVAGSQPRSEELPRTRTCNWTSCGTTCHSQGRNLGGGSQGSWHQPKEWKQRLLMTLQAWYCGLHACDSFHNALIFAPCSFSCSIPCTFEILHQPDGHEYDGWRIDCLLYRYTISWRHHDDSGLKHITPPAFVQAQLAKRNTDDALNRAAESLRHETVYAVWRCRCNMTNLEKRLRIVSEKVPMDTRRTYIVGKEC